MGWTDDRMPAHPPQRQTGRQTERQTPWPHRQGKKQRKIVFVSFAFIMIRECRKYHINLRRCRAGQGRNSNNIKYGQWNALSLYRCGLPLSIVLWVTDVYNKEHGSRNEESEWNINLGISKRREGGGYRNCYNNNK